MRQKDSDAPIRLTEYNLEIFEPTNKGTIATLISMGFPIDQVTKAVGYPSQPLVIIKKDLIRTLDSHFKQERPSALPEASETTKTNLIPQQSLPFKYNQFLNKHGYLEQSAENMEAIPKGHAHILMEIEWTIDPKTIKKKNCERC